MTGRKTIVGVLVCLVVGVGVGWGIKGGQDEGLQERPASKSKARARKSNRQPRPANVTGMVGRVDGQKGTSRKMRSAYSLAMSVPLERIEEWLAGDYFDTPDARVDTFFYRILYDRFLDADPEACLTYCIYKEEETDVTSRYLKEWTSRDPTAVLAFLRGMTDRRRMGPVAGVVLEQLAETDFEGAMDLMKELGQRGGVESWGLKPSLQKLADADPERLLQASQGWNAKMRAQVLQQAAQGMLKKDFNEGLDWLLALPGEKGHQVFAQMANGQAEFGVTLLEHAADLPDGWMNDIVASNTWQMVRADPERWLDADGEELGLKKETAARVRENALSQLVSKDWRKASLWLDSPDLSERARKSLLSNLVSHLSRRSTEEAKAWTDGLKDPELQKAAVAQIETKRTSNSNTVQGAQPAGIIAAAASDTSFSNSHSMRYWSAWETSEAMSAFRELDQEEQNLAAKNLVGQMHYLPPEMGGMAVRVLLESQQASGEDQNRSQTSSRRLRGLAESWGSADPAAAARWVETLPAGKERDQAATTVLNSWRLQAPEEAERWLGGLGDEWESLREGE